MLFVRESKMRSQVSSWRQWSALKVDSKHMSPIAQNEILQIMALKVLRDIASDIAESDIMADKSTDASNIEQLVICKCWWTRICSMWGIYCSDDSRSDKCRYNWRLHQRCAALYETQNSRCLWVVRCWLFNHDLNQKWDFCTNQETEEKKSADILLSRTL